MSLTSSPKPPFTNPDIRKELEVVSSAPSRPSRRHFIDGKYYIAQVTEIHRPGQEEVDKDLPGYQERAGRMLAQNLFQSVVSDLKFHGEVDVNPAVLTE